MKPILRALAVLCLIGLLLTGCTTTDIRGEKVGDSTLPIQKILVFADDSSRFQGQSTYNPSSVSLNTTTKKIFQALEARLPIIFKLNGLEADVQLSSKQVVATSPPPSHVITLTPKAGNKVNLMTRVHMEGQLYEARSKRTLWKGTISYGGLVAETTGNGSADAFAKTLLIQLKKDGVLNYSTSEPIMPTE